MMIEVKCDFNLLQGRTDAQKPLPAMLVTDVIVG